MYTVDVQLTLDQCRAVKIKPAEGRIEALDDGLLGLAGMGTGGMGGVSGMDLKKVKGYSLIADGLYDGTSNHRVLSTVLYGN